MPLAEDPNHWRKLVVDAGALIWIDDKENWKAWEKEMGWWRKLRARLFVTDKHNPNPQRPTGPILGR